MILFQTFLVLWYTIRAKDVEVVNHLFAFVEMYKEIIERFNCNFVVVSDAAEYNLNI